MKALVGSEIRPCMYDRTIPALLNEFRRGEGGSNTSCAVAVRSDVNRDTEDNLCRRAKLPAACVITGPRAWSFLLFFASKLCCRFQCAVRLDCMMYMIDGLISNDA